jgi:hypothetical protein
MVATLKTCLDGPIAFCLPPLLNYFLLKFSQTSFNSNSYLFMCERKRWKFEYISTIFVHND